VTERWSSPAESSSTPATREYERQLSLVDRILGLEARVAELSVEFDLAPEEKLRAEQMIQRMRSSLEWRIGRIVALPALVVRRRLRRVR
jgi:hypothetical protein